MQYGGGFWKGSGERLRGESVRAKKCPTREERLDSGCEPSQHFHTENAKMFARKIRMCSNRHILLAALGRSQNVKGEKYVDETVLGDSLLEEWRADAGHAASSVAVLKLSRCRRK